MLRIHLGAADLGRIRFATEPAPVLETVLMLHELRQGPCSLGDDSDEWRDRVLSTFPVTARPLLNLVPSRHVALYFDVLTPDAGDAFHRIRTMATPILEHDLNQMTRLNIAPVPTWLRRFASGEDTVRHTLDDALRTFHRTCLAPHWSSATARFHDDVTHRMVTLRKDGITAVLNTLSPDLRLNGLTLEGRYPWDRQIHLTGQGLVLIPSAFWTGYPLVTWDDQEPSRYVLIYPARANATSGSHGGTRTGGGPGDVLASLLGPTRATVLMALRQPQTTGGIARLTRISASSVSQHTATLRDAGLITSNRAGKAVEHRLTTLGHALLHG